MRLLFVYPEFGAEIRWSELLALGVASAALKREGHQVELLYLKHPSQIALLDSLAAQPSPSVAFAYLAWDQWPAFRSAARAIRRALPKTLMVAGGPYPMLDPDEVIEEPAIHAICLGECERPLADLAARLESHEKVMRSPSFWIKSRQGELVKNPLGPLEENLDALPYADRLLFGHAELVRATGGAVPMLAGRGCPHECRFCHLPVFRRAYRGKGEFVRARSPMNIVGEALEIAQREMAERFDFVDEYFPSEPAWLSRFCAVWKAQVARPFRFTAIAESLSAQNLAALKDAGCEAIRLHIDTGNEKFRARIATRNLGNARLASVCAEAARLGIRVDIHAMTGLPLENPDLATETVEFIRALKSDSVSISFYAPIPGTPLFEFARDKQREVDPADFNPRRPRMRLASMDDADALRAYDALARLRRQRMIERAGPIDAYADWVGQADSAIVEAPFRPALEIAEAAIGGDKRLCLMQAIGARIGFPVEIRNGAALAFGLAMGPSPFGVRFAGTLKIEVRIRQGGADDLAFYKILDPASAAAPAGWMDLTIPLAGRTEGPAEIWLECEPLESPAPPAPAYLAWARPRLFIPQAVRSAPARAEAARSDPRLEDSTHGDTLLLEDEIRELKADNKRLRDEVENLKFDLERRTDLIAKLNAEFEKMTRDISALEEQKSAWLRIRAEVEAKLGRKARKAFEEAEGAL